MIKEHKEYLAKLGAQDPLLERISAIIEFYTILSPEEIETIFVSEYKTKDGERIYENLWLVSSNYIMEAKNFLKEDDFDIMPYKNTIQYLRIKKIEYNYQLATEQSRLTANFSFSTSTSFGGEIKASSENCDYLKNIIEKYLQPNIEI